jgi:hypothetical protein
MVRIPGAQDTIKLGLKDQIESSRNENAHAGTMWFHVNLLATQPTDFAWIASLT